LKERTPNQSILQLILASIRVLVDSFFFIFVTQRYYIEGENARPIILQLILALICVHAVSSFLLFLAPLLGRLKAKFFFV
jgi:hypothetical protein